MPTVSCIPSYDYKGYSAYHISQFDIPPNLRSARSSTIDTIPIHEWSLYELPTSMMEWPSMLLLMPTSAKAHIPLLQTPRGTQIVMVVLHMSAIQ